MGDMEKEIFAGPISGLTKGGRAIIPSVGAGVREERASKPLFGGFSEEVKDAGKRLIKEILPPPLNEYAPEKKKKKEAEAVTWENSEKTDKSEAGHRMVPDEASQGRAVQQPPTKAERAARNDAQYTQSRIGHIEQIFRNMKR